MQGDTAFHWDCVQRSYQWNGISSLASWTYLQSDYICHLHFRWHGMGLSREPLYLTFQFLLCTFEAIWCLLIYLLKHYYFWGACFEPVFARDLGFRNFITKIAYYFMEIYLKSTILCGCTLLGFSSHRIISLIQFLLVRVTYDITYDAWRMLHCYT